NIFSSLIDDRGTIATIRGTRCLIDHASEPRPSIHTIRHLHPHRITRRRRPPGHLPPRRHRPRLNSLLRCPINRARRATHTTRRHHLIRQVSRHRVLPRHRPDRPLSTIHCDRSGPLRRPRNDIANEHLSHLHNRESHTRIRAITSRHQQVFRHPLIDCV